MDVTYLTSSGAESLQGELEALEGVDRPGLVTQLKEAIAQGDLSENADYHDTKEKLGFVDGRISRIKGILAMAVVINGVSRSDKVRIGSTVVVQFEGEDEEEQYQIVDSPEASPAAQKISQKSPIGSALIGKKAGDKIEIEVPGGVTRLEVLSIS